LLVLAFCSACTEQVPTLYVTATALVDTTVAPPDDGLPADFGHYRWELVEAPRGENAGDLSAQTAAITIRPPSRGIYVFDRWFVGDAGEQLSCRVVLTVAGVPPVAHVVGPTMVSVGAATMLDGSGSTSLERFTLSFQWRLASRPASSAVEPAGTTSPTVMFAPDAAGSYGVELRVFDGELWSAAATTTVVAQ
jgi:hypothetical protein